MEFSPTSHPTFSPWRPRIYAVVGAVLAAVVIWVVAVPVLGVNLQATTGPGSTELATVPIGAVIAASLLAPLAGLLLLVLLERFTNRARLIWSVIAGLVLLLSYGAPVFGTGIPASSRITLALMHTAVGGIVIGVFTRSSASR